MAVYLIYDGLHPLNPGNVCHFVNSMYLSECRWNCSCDCTTKCILFHNHSHSNGKQEKLFTIMQEKREVTMNIAVLRIDCNWVIVIANVFSLAASGFSCNLLLKFHCLIGTSFQLVSFKCCVIFIDLQSFLIA